MVECNGRVQADSQSSQSQRYGQSYLSISDMICTANTNTTRNERGCTCNCAAMIVTRSPALL